MKDRSKEQGMILVMSLWIMLILSLLLLALAQTVNMNTEQASAFKCQTSGEAIARGAIYATVQELLELHGKSDKNPQSSDKQEAKSNGELENKLIQGDELGFYLVDALEWKVLKQTPTSEFGGDRDCRDENYVLCQVSAEDAKAPLNKLKEKNWSRIPAVSKELAATITKFIKEKDGKLSCVEELLAIKELQGPLYDGSESSPGLQNFITAFSDGKLYINRASATAIAATLDIEMEKAVAIAEAVKNKRYFSSMKSLEDSSGANAQVLNKTVRLTCNAYRIKAYAVIHGHVHKLEAVIVLTPKNSFRIAYMGNA